MAEPEARPLGPGFLLLGLAGPLLVPPLVFGGVALASGMGTGGAWATLVEQFAAGQRNLFVVSALGLFPVLLLLAVLRLGRRYDPDGAWRRAGGWSALVVILLVLAWANLEFWPLFLPERVYPGFPHGLELVIAPALFAPLAGALALVVAALVVRRSS